MTGVNTPTFPLLDDGAGNQYAIFTVVYDADPLLETVSSLLESPDYRPAGVDVLVKSGPLILIEDMDITYTKKVGTKTTLSVARDKIVEYARTAGHPDAFRQTEIHDIMRNAGAARVLEVSTVGRIFVSAAGRLLRDTVPDPGVADILADWATESDPFEIIPVADIETINHVAAVHVVRD